jgi:hypothetical protein
MDTGGLGTGRRLWVWVSDNGLRRHNQDGYSLNLIGKRLCARWDRAKSEYADQLEAFIDFSAQQAAHIPGW